MTFIELLAVLGNLGEFVGSVAMLATLLYLAVQVRHSRELLARGEKIALSQVYSDRANARVTAYITMTESSLIPDLYDRVLKGDGQYRTRLEQLSNTNRGRLDSYVKAQITNYDNWLYQHDLGLLDESATEEMSDSIIRWLPFWEATDNFIPARITRWQAQHGDR
jgi:hypothetical protein